MADISAAREQDPTFANMQIAGLLRLMQKEPANARQVSSGVREVVSIEATIRQLLSGTVRYGYYVFFIALAFSQ